METAPFTKDLQSNDIILYIGMVLLVKNVEIIDEDWVTVNCEDVRTREEIVIMQSGLARVHKID